MFSSVQLIPRELETLQKILKNINSLFHDHRDHCKPRKVQQLLAPFCLFVCHDEQAAAALAAGDKSTTEIPCGHPDRPKVQTRRSKASASSQRCITTPRARVRCFASFAHSHSLSPCSSAAAGLPPLLLAASVPPLEPAKRHRPVQLLSCRAWSGCKAA